MNVGVISADILFNEQSIDASIRRLEERAKQIKLRVCPELCQDKVFTYKVDDKPLQAFEQSINRLIKFTQAQQLTLNLKVKTPDISDNLAKILANGDRTITIRDRVATNSRTGYQSDTKDVIIGLSKIESELKRFNQKSNKSVLGTIATGGFEAVGQIVTQSINRGLKQDLGINLNAIARPFTKTIAKPLSKLTPENKQQFEDEIVSALEDLFVFNNQTGFNQKLKSAFKPAIDDLKTATLESIGSVITSASQPLRIRNRVLLARSAQQAQAKAETPLNLTKEQREQIEQSESITFATGGFGYDKGRNSAMTAALMQNVIPNTYAIPADNPYMNNKDTLGRLKAFDNNPRDRNFLKYLHLSAELGYNPDSVDIASKVMQYRKEFPDKPINLTGYSGGGNAVEQALGILQRAGYGENVKGVGLLTPNVNLTGVAKPGTYKALMGDVDPMMLTMFGNAYTAQSSQQREAYKQTVTGLQKEGLPMLTGMFKKPEYMEVFAEIGEAHNLYKFAAQQPVQNELASFFNTSKKPDTSIYQGDAGVLNLGTARELAHAKFDYGQVLEKLLGNENITPNVDEKEVTDISSLLPKINKTIKEFDGKKRKRVSSPSLKITLDETVNFLKETQEAIEAFVENKTDIESKLIRALDTSGNQSLIEQYKAKFEQKASEFMRLTSMSDNEASKLTPKGLQANNETLQNLQSQGYNKDLILNTKMFSSINEPFLKLKRFNDSISGITGDVSQFQSAYAQIKQSLDKRRNDYNPGLATGTASITLQNIGRARTDIETTRSTLGVERIGTTEANTINQLLSQLSQVEKNIKRSFAKAKITLPPIEPPTNLEAIGEQVIAGTTEGIGQKLGELKAKSSEISEVIVETVKSDLEIQSPSRVFVGIGRFVIEGFQKGLESLNIDYTKLLDFGKLAGIVAIGVNLFRDFGGELLNVARDFERIQIKLEYSVSGFTAVTTAMTNVRSEAKRLGLDLKSTAEGYSDFFGATKGTNITPFVTENIFKGVQEAGVARQLTPLDMEGVNRATVQIANKGTVQREELVGQLGERLTGTLELASRSRGQSVAEFNRETARGGITSEDFLPQFAQTLSADAALTLPKALQSSQATINRYQNSIVELQGILGKPLVDIQNTGLRAFTVVIEGLTKALPFLANMLGVVVLRSIVNLLPEIRYLGRELLRLSTGSSIISGLKSIGGQFTRLAAQTALLTVATESLLALTRAFSNASGELDKLSSASSDSLKRFKDIYAESQKGETLKRFNRDKDLPLLQDNQGGSYLPESAIGQGLLGFLPDRVTETSDNLQVLGFSIRGAVQKIESYFGNYAEKAKTDRVNAVKGLIQTSNETNQAVGQIINQGIVQQTNDIDKQLQALQGKRRGIALLNPGDSEGLSQIAKQEEELLKKRDKISRPALVLQSQSAVTIDALKKSIAELERVSSIPSEYQATYRNQAEQLKAQLKEAELAQIQLNRAIKDGLSTFTLFGQRIDQIVSKFKDYQVSNQNLSLGLQSQVNQFGNVSPEQKASIKQQLEIQLKSQELLRLQESLNELGTLLNEKLPTIANYGVGGSTGENELATLSEQLTNDPNAKLVIEKLIEYKKLQQEIPKLVNEITQQQSDLANTLSENRKAIIDFYRELINNADNLTLETRGLANQNTLTNAKSKLKSSLVGNRDSFVTQYVDGLIGLIEQLNKPLENALDAQKQLLAVQQQRINQSLQLNQLQKQAPVTVNGQLTSDSGSSATGNFSLKRFNRQPLSIVESVGGSVQTVKRYEDLEKHHPSSGREPNRSYRNVEGRLEEVTTQNQGLVKKDFVLIGKNNQQLGIDLPSPVNGTAYNRGNGRVDILDSLGKLIARFEHVMSPVGSGTRVSYGETIGKQSAVNSKAIHTHLELDPITYRKYIQDLRDGTFEGVSQGFNSASNSPSLKRFNTEGLTAKGKKYAQIAQDPRVQAALEAIAIAEVGKKLVSQGKGYGKQIGGNYGVEEFANPEKLTAIPKNIRGGKQTAFGRYQLHQPDFDWAKRDLGVKNLSPANQDIIGVQRLVFRGALEPLLKGDLKTFIAKAGNEFASLQGSKHNGDGLNATTEGGKSNAFITNYNNALKRFNGNVTLQPQAKVANQLTQSSQSISYGIANKKELELSGKQLLANISQQEANIYSKLNADNKLAVLESQIQKTKLSNQFDDGLKDAETQANQASRRLQDQRQNIGYDTPQKQRDTQIRDINREYVDTNRDLIKQLSELQSARRTLAATKELITSGEFPQLADQLPQINGGLKRLDTSIITVSSALEQTSKVREARLKDVDSKFAVEQQKRTDAFNVTTARNEAQRLKSLADGIEQNQGANINDLSGGDPIRMRAQAQNLETIANLTEQITGLEELARTGERTTEQIAKLRAQYENLAKIELDNTSAKLQNDLYDRILKAESRNLAIEEKTVSYEREKTEQLARRNELILQNTPGRLDIDNPTKLRLNSQISGGEFELKSSINQIRQFAFEQKLSVDVTQKLIDQVTELDSLKLDNLRREQKNVLLDQLRQIKEQRFELLKRFNDSDNTVLQSQSDFYTTRGLSGKEQDKQVAINQQNFAFTEGLKGIDDYARSVNLSADKVAKLRNELALVNQIKLDNIQAQFDPFQQVATSAIGGIQSSIEGLLNSEFKLSDFGNAFMSFGETIANTLSKLAAEWLTNELVRGIFGIKAPSLPDTSSNGAFGGMGGILGSLGSILGFADGGQVKAVNHQKLRELPVIGDALKLEGGNAILATLTPGEHVLNTREAEVYRKLYPNGIPRYKQGGAVGNVNFPTNTGNSNTYNINIPVTNNGGGNTNDIDVRALQRVVIAELDRQSQQGGMFYNR